MAVVGYLYTESFLDRGKGKIYENRFGDGDDNQRSFLEIRFNGKRVTKSVRGQKEDVQWSDSPESPVGRILAKVKRFDEGAGVRVMCKDETELDKLIAGDIKEVWEGEGFFDDDPICEHSGECEYDAVLKIGDKITF